MPHRKLRQEIMARFGLTSRSPDTLADVPPTADGNDLETVERVQRLEARIAHLEAMVEGLQDSVDREIRRVDDCVADLRERTEPDKLSRALSAEARRRGV
jgi:uncharacterized coiled-coil protein SlyX